MTPEQAITRAAKGEVLPVYLLLGEETYLRDQVLEAIVAAADVGNVRGFNHDKLIATETKVESVLAAARTAPMMAKQRLVVLSGVERWDGRKGNSAPFDALDEYAGDPAPWTVLVVVASKLNGSRKLVKNAKKRDFVVACNALAPRQLPSWIARTAKAKGHAMDSSLAALIAELVGPELAPVADALERLSLYAGAGAPITEDAVSAVVTRVRQDTVWALVDALAEGDAGTVMACLRDAYDGAGLPLLGAVAWKVRQLLKYSSLVGRGQSSAAAAKGAGVGGNRAWTLEKAAKRLSRAELERWLMCIAEADLALKGSRRGGEQVLTTLFTDLCRRPVS